MEISELWQYQTIQAAISDNSDNNSQLKRQYQTNSGDNRQLRQYHPSLAIPDNSGNNFNSDNTRHRKLENVTRMLLRMFLRVPGLEGLLALDVGQGGDELGPGSLGDPFQVLLLATSGKSFCKNSYPVMLCFIMYIEVRITVKRNE